jgi:hypothetical protein
VNGYGPTQLPPWATRYGGIKRFTLRLKPHLGSSRFTQQKIEFTLADLKAG